MSILFCDSNCELWYDVANNLNLKVIKMPYVLEGEEYYYDLGKATDFKRFYTKLKAGCIPTTAALNKFNYIEYFEPYLQQGEDILYITFSHNLSATFDFMKEAIEELKIKYPERTIRFFDTKSISMGCGFQVYYAAKLKEQGATDDEILAFLEDFSKKTATYFIVNDLNHLKRGGRISAVKAAVGALIGIKPVIKVTDEGKLDNCAKVRGAKNVISEIVNIVQAKATNLDKYDIWVMHADCEDVANAVAMNLKERLGANVNVHTQIVGPVIATHCGQGTIGIIFSATAR